MHTKEALETGLDQEKIDSLIHWRDSKHFDDRERAALQWVEETTTLDDFEGDIKMRLSEHFSEREIVDLTLCVALWQRLTV